MPKRKVTLPLNPDLVDEATNLQMSQLATLLAKQYMENGSSFDLSGFFQDMSRRFVEACTEAEMEHFLESQKAPKTQDGREVPAEAQESVEDDLEDSEEASTPRNKRNGYSDRTVRTTHGSFPVKMPRDRNGEFTSGLLPKYARMFPDLEEKVIRLYAVGTSTRDISEMLTDLYHTEISPSLVSTITDRILTDVQQWQTRPVDEVYSVLFVDALRVKIRHEGKVKPMAVNLVLSVDLEGKRDVLGIWITENEGAAFWSDVFAELRNRGMKDVMMVVSDGLKGMTEAIETHFSNALHQKCIVHLIRASTKAVPMKDKKAVCAALKTIYAAPTEDAAMQALQAFKESELGQKYRHTARTWESSWDQVVPFFSYAPEIRTLIYTTNSIESLNRTVRKVIKSTGCFPSLDSAMKLIYLAIMGITRKWRRASPRWSAALPHFACKFGERFLKAHD